MPGEMSQPQPLPALLLLLCCPWASASESGLCWVPGGCFGALSSPWLTLGWGVLQVLCGVRSWGATRRGRTPTRTWPS